MTSLTLITSLNDLSPNTVKLVGIVSTCELGVLVVQSCPHVTPWTAAHQASLSLEFSRQENWSGLAFLSPGDFPNPRIEPSSPALQADSLPSEPPGKPFTLRKNSIYGLEQGPVLQTLPTELQVRADPWA